MNDIDHNPRINVSLSLEEAQLIQDQLELNQNPILARNIEEAERNIEEAERYKAEQEHRASLASDQPA